VALLALVVAAVMLWFADPSHQPTGGSRILWPAPTPTAH
jgi:hypothetical protein